jgi:hypothetical protein
MHTRTKVKDGWALAVLTAALIGGLGMSAHAAPPDPEEREVMLVVDVGELAGRLGVALDEQLRGALREEGVAVVEDGVGSTIEVRVEMLDVELRSYAISVAVIVDEQREVVAEGVSCMACSEARVVEVALEQLGGAVTRLPAVEVEVVPEVAAEVVPEVVADRRDRWRLDLGPVGFAGAVSIMGGLATAGAGGLVFSLENKVEPDATYRFSADTVRSMGVPLVIAGGAAALLGVVAVVVDTQVLGPRRRRLAGVDVSVDVSPTRAGLWMKGRF